MNSIVFPLFSLLFLLTVGLTSPARLYSEMTKIKVGHTTIGPDHGWLWVAKEKKIFEKYGLDPEIVFIGSGAISINGLIAGNLDLTFGDAVGPILANAKVPDVVIIASPINYLMYSLVGSRGITEISRLKGKRVGVNRFGAISDFQTQAILGRAGMDPRKDVTFLQIGGSAERLAALEKGLVEAALLNPPSDFQAKRMGLNILQIPDIEFVSHGLATTRTYIKRHPAVTTNMLKAMIEAIHFFKTRPKETIEILSKHLKQNDLQVVEYGYKIVARLYDIRLIPQETAFRTTLEILREAKAVTAENDLKNAFFFSQVEELEANGFISNISKR